MNHYSLGVVLVWQIAANETAHARHKFIEPEYLFKCRFDQGRDVLDPSQGYYRGRRCVDRLGVKRHTISPGQTEQGALLFEK